jgi:hypothetical protein
MYNDVALVQRLGHPGMNECLMTEIRRLAILDLLGRFGCSQFSPQLAESMRPRKLNKTERCVIPRLITDFEL